MVEAGCKHMVTAVTDMDIIEIQLDKSINTDE